MDIRILPSNIANMIAAGEVVQRPASVVKELVENAVDAGATKINVVIRDAGRTLIQVIDNGCGMTPDQAVLCFERHATSKIATAEDLQAIETFGFRGEALASIAAVAEVDLKTRTHDSEVATQVTLTDATALNPAQQNVREVAAPVGSNFSVRNLFYNTPARRKFLKSDATEMKAIINEFIRVALTRPDLSFSLTSDDKYIYRLSPVQGTKYRIRDLLGENVADGLSIIEAETSVATIGGFIGRPDESKKVAANQFFFVNGRYFRSPYLHKAVMKAYENLIPEGTQPSYFIYLKVDPHSVDINVHPTKTEIKFEDDGVLFTILCAAVREALGRNSFTSDIDFDREGVPELPNLGSSFSDFRPVSEPTIGTDPNFNPFETDGFPNQQWYNSKPSLKQEDLSRLFDVQTVQAARPHVLKCGRYLITLHRGNLMMVDTIRAMQRILYERFMDALAKNEAVSGAVLFPVEVEVGAANIPLLEENKDLLKTLGFDLAPYSTNTVVVNAVPEGLVDDKMAVSALIYEILTALSEEKANIAATMYSSVAERFALSAARQSAIPSSDEECYALIDTLFATSSFEFTSDGHRTALILDSDKINKMF